MKRVKVGTHYSNKTKANNDDVVLTRVLRSHKRKLVELEKEEKDGAGNVVAEKQNICSTEGSDCIILSEGSAPKIETDKKEPEAFLTSTPLFPSHAKKPKFDESDIKFCGTPKSKYDSDDIIIISDSSTAALPVVVISDGDKTDSEIEILPLKNTGQKTPLKNDKKSDEILRFKENLNYPKNLFVPAHIRQFPSRPSARPLSKKRGKNALRKKRRDRLRKASVKPSTKVTQPCNSVSQTQIGENIYVEKPIVLPKTGLRPIIIDGSNVAFHHSNNSYFSCRGLEICIKYFKKRGHQVTAFVPKFRVQSKKSDNPKLLDQLVRNGDVILTPSRIVDGNPIVSYDDRYIVQTAVLKGGIIVTRDNYRDLLSENPAWADTIKYRLLQFTWVQDILMFPSDPLGEKGPNLEEFLRFG